MLGKRGENTQSAMHDYDPSTGIIFFSQVGISGVSCWNTEKPLTTVNHVLLQQNDETMVYPCDLNVITFSAL